MTGPHLSVLARRWLALGLVSLALVAVACSSGGGQPVSDAERAQVLAFSEPKSDKLLAGFNANDYAAFSGDFDEAMLKGIPPAEFANLRSTLLSKIGEYRSREVSSVQKQEQFYVVLYRGRFTLDDAVTVRVVFTATPDHKVTGLWFDSPKLR